MEQVWLSSAQHGWLPAAHEAGDVHVDPLLSVKRVAPLPEKIALSDTVTEPRASQDAVSVVADMTELGEVSEAAMLHNLYLRYCSDQSSVYTAVGGVLVSLNPYKPSPELYGPERMAMYHQHGDSPIHPGDADGVDADSATTSARGRNAPHLYAVVEAAYSELLATSRDQALVMSGESGAGKTEACKLAMDYLASASAATKNSVAADEAAQRVSRCMLESNVVLESLGNAKTYRNDNSSRFGKW